MFGISYFSLLLLVAAGELIRRVCRILIIGFSGPLSRVPGPFWNKLSPFPWRIAFLRGTAFVLAQNLHRKYGDVVRVAPNLILVSDSSSVRKVLVDWDLPKSPLYEKYRQNPHIATLFTERDKAKYRIRRRLLSNGFSVSYLKALEPLMLSCIQILQDVLEERCKAADDGSVTVNIYDLISSLASDIMSESSFGGSFGLVRHGHHPLKTRITEYMKKVAIFQTIPLLKYVATPQDEELDATVQSILARRLSAEKADQRRDLLQIMVDASAEDPESLSHEHVKAEMFVFLLAGSDTSAATATFALMQLLDNPQALANLVRELDASLAFRDSPINDENTRILPYLNGVIYETLRLLPPAAGGFARQIVMPTVLHDYMLPAGTLVTADTTTLHRDPREWPDPDSFIPERWVDGHKGVSASERNWYPFSAGSRTCIGKQFALKEVRLILAVLLRRFEISRISNQDIEFRHHSVLYIKSGEYLVDFRQRQA